MGISLWLAMVTPDPSAPPAAAQGPALPPSGEGGGSARPPGSPLRSRGLRLHSCVKHSHSGFVPDVTL